MDGKVYSRIKLVVLDENGNKIVDRFIQDLPTLSKGYQVHLEATPISISIIGGAGVEVKFNGNPKPITSPAFVTERAAFGNHHCNFP